MFGFIYHALQEENSKLNVFKLTGNTIVKSDWLAKIVQCLTETRHADDRVSIALFDIDWSSVVSSRVILAAIWIKVNLYQQNVASITLLALA